jgi:cell division protein FtsL
VGEVLGSHHGRGFVIWAAALVTGLVCVWQHVHSNELALEIEALRSTREAVETEIGFLEMECAALSKRQRVEEYARERLGMRYPEAGEVIWLGPSESERAAGVRDDYVLGETARDTEG